MYLDTIYSGIVILYSFIFSSSVHFTLTRISQLHVNIWLKFIIASLFFLLFLIYAIKIVFASHANMNTRIQITTNHTNCTLVDIAF